MTVVVIDITDKITPEQWKRLNKVANDALKHGYFTEDGKAEEKEKEESQKQQQQQQDPIAQHIKNQEIAYENSMKLIAEMNQVIERLTNMEEWQRRELKRNLQPGKVFTLELAETCKDYMLQLVNQMPESHIPVALDHTRILGHMVNIFDGMLYDEYKKREKNKHLYST